MIVANIVKNVELQCAVHFCYYDYEANERIEIGKFEALAYEVKYMYCEDDELWIEVECDEN